MRIDWAGIFAHVINFKTEPARAVARITAALTALVTAFTAWGIDMSQEAQTAVISTGAGIAVTALAVAKAIRPFVSPTAKAEQAIENALALDPNAPVAPPTAATMLENAEP